MPPFWRTPQSGATCECTSRACSHDQRTSQLENDYLTAVQFVRNTENMLRRLKDEHNKLRHDNAELRVLAAGQSPHAPLSSTRTFRSP